MLCRGCVRDTLGAVCIIIRIIISIIILLIIIVIMTMIVIMIIIICTVDQIPSAPTSTDARSAGAPRKWSVTPSASTSYLCSLRPHRRVPGARGARSASRSA